MIHHKYPEEFEIKDTTDTVKSASYLAIQIYRDSMEKENYLLNYTTNTMTFHSVLSIFLLSLATSLQHLRMEFSYHNSYVMPELAVATQTFCIALDLG